MVLCNHDPVNNNWYTDSILGLHTFRSYSNAWSLLITFQYFCNFVEVFLKITFKDIAKKRIRSKRDHHLSHSCTFHSNSSLCITTLCAIKALFTSNASWTFSVCLIAWSIAPFGTWLAVVAKETIDTYWKQKYSLNSYGMYVNSLCTTITGIKN